MGCGVSRLQSAALRSGACPAPPPSPPRVKKGHRKEPTKPPRKKKCRRRGKELELSAVVTSPTDTSASSGTKGRKPCPPPRPPSAPPPRPPSAPPPRSPPGSAIAPVTPTPAPGLRRHSERGIDDDFDRNRLFSVAPSQLLLDEMRQIITDWFNGMPLFPPDDPCGLGDLQGVAIAANRIQSSQTVSEIADEDAANGMPCRDELDLDRDEVMRKASMAAFAFEPPQEEDESRRMTVANVAMLPARICTQVPRNMRVASVDAEDGEWMYQLDKLEAEHKERQAQKAKERQLQP